MAQRRLARIAGIDIQFHLSWISILALIGLTLGEYFQAANPHWAAAVAWGAAAATTVLFFAAVVLHELAHSLVARAKGLPVQAITLFVFGGVSELTREPEDAKSEFQIAIAGPLMSLALGAACLGLSRLGSPHAPVIAVLLWLGWINLALALFNLIPGFPLDGGRVLRAILWNASHDFTRATRQATQVGKICAAGFILYGLFAFFGWFLLTAAEQSWRRTEAQAALGNYTVRDLETPFYSRVPPEWNLESFITEVASLHNYRASLVMDGEDQLLGIITPGDLAQVPRSRWGTTLVREIMRPRSEMATVQPAEGLASALRKMAEQDVAQLPILSDGGVRGVIRRDRILALLHAQL